MSAHDDDNLTERLWSLARGSSDPDLERHLSSCSACRQELGTLSALARFQQTTGGGLTEPPAALHAATVDLFRKLRPDLVTQSRSAVDRARDALRRITAELIVDTGLTPQLAGVRATGDRATRQLAFVSDIADLDIEIARREGTSEVAGQLGMDTVPAGLEIAFAPATEGAATVRAAIADDGQFIVTLPPGEWIASVELGDAMLLFPGIRI